MKIIVNTAVRDCPVAEISNHLHMPLSSNQGVETLFTAQFITTLFRSPVRVPRTVR
jgi:hypothetical protein